MATQHSLSKYRGYLFAAWKGESGNDCLYYWQFNTASGNWATIKPSAAVLPGRSSAGPSLASDSTTLFAGWRGEEDDNRLYFSMMFSTGLGWTAPTEIAGALSKAAPALAVMGKTLVALWAKPDSSHAAGNDGGLMFATTAIRPGVAVGSTAFSGAALPVRGAFSKASPVVAVSADGQTLYAVWAGPEEHAHLWYSTLTGTQEWSNPAPLGMTSAAFPSLAFLDGELWIAWRDTQDGSLRLQTLRCLVAGASGVMVQASSAAADGTIAMAECNGKLYAMWSGANEGKRLALAILNGNEATALVAAPEYGAATRASGYGLGVVRL